MTRNRIAFLASPIVTIALPPSPAGAAPQPLDLKRSTVTIFVSKSGLFSALADNHTIRAPLAGGSISAEPPLAVEVSIQAADLVVLDPDLSASKRAEVQTRMLGPEVLDVKTYPQITFASTAVEPAGTDQLESQRAADDSRSHPGRHRSGHSRQRTSIADA